MPFPTPLPGATAIRFDDAAARTAIAHLHDLVRDLRALRDGEARHAGSARVDWRGPSRDRFEARRAGFDADLDAAIRALLRTIDHLTAHRLDAAARQEAANAEERHERERDLARLAALAAPAA